MTKSRWGWTDEFGAAVAESFTSFLPVHVDVEAQLPLSPLKTVQKLDPNDFLSMLNFTAKSKEGHLGQLNRISARLRRWVDDWLDSGRTAEGVECPATRNSEVVSAAVDEYSKRGKMRLVGSKDGLQLWFDLQAEKAPPTTGGFAEKIFIETVAGEKLALFLLSDLSIRLAKCRAPECGRYYLLKHSHRTYRTGTLCDECRRARSSEGRAAATDDERSDAKTRLHKFVAKRFRTQIIENPDWRKDPKLKDQIAQFLNGRIERSASLAKVYPSGVTGKWVANAKNWGAIEAATRKDGGSLEVSVSL